MCNLYGFRSNKPTKIECALVEAQNANLILSEPPRPTGWGLVTYDGPAPSLERRAASPQSDLSFGVKAASNRSRTTIAHVRYSTVGRPSIANTQPFTIGRWTFAHEGTFWKFRDFESELAAGIDSTILAQRKGKTDSEMIFLWLLTQLKNAGLDIGSGVGTKIEEASTAIAHGLWGLEDLSLKHGAVRKPRLTCLLTDGTAMFAAAWRSPLFWIERDTISECSICGESHITEDSSVGYRAIALASNPFTNEAWKPLPDTSLLVIDSDLTTEQRLIEA